MPSIPEAQPARNDPCPCGSGKKYKQCCGRQGAAAGVSTTRAVASKPGISPVKIVVAMAIVSIASVLLVSWKIRNEQPAAQAATPAAWEYDPVLDQHWDPSHAHWHRGRPPAGMVGTGTEATPTPWQYNPVTNLHWDPTHGHWHEGPPPAGMGAPVAGAPQEVITSPLTAPAPSDPSPEPAVAEPAAVP
jgi:hypothetical protein